MSYAAYMLNALISTFLFMLSETPLHVDLANFVIFLFYLVPLQKHDANEKIFSFQPIILLGFTCITFIASFAMVLLFENPIAMLLNKFKVKTVDERKKQ